VTALSIFKKKYPDYRRAEIERVSKAAIDYIHRVQRADGSWYGSWGIVSPRRCVDYQAAATDGLPPTSQCFTYATSKPPHSANPQPRADG
jgi:hypothetical protein